MPGLNFTWSKVGEEIDLGKSSQLTIKNISRTDAGQYNCAGTNGTATWIAVATVIVFCEYSSIIHRRYSSTYSLQKVKQEKNKPFSSCFLSVS